MTWRVDTGDCVDLMARMEPASVDAVVCDPPYGIRFMGKAWDGADIAAQAKLRASQAQPPTKYGGIRDVPRVSPAEAAGTYDLSARGTRAFQAWCETWATASLRVLKPGGHLLAFGGTRTSHRLVCAIEDAGFEIRDTICWMYGSGFPKSHNLNGDRQGWGTALKPAHEPIVVARKPLSGTVAQTVLEHGTGALNVDGCRVDGEPWKAHRATGLGSVKFLTEGDTPEIDKEPHALGRWPANVVLDEEAARLLDEQSGELTTNSTGTHAPSDYGMRNVVYGQGLTGSSKPYGDDSGGASRFYYTAKASRAERNAGLDGFEEKVVHDGRHTPISNPYLRAETKRLNTHPTVKPVSLMRWLVRLVTPPGGIVLDPFAGSGTTGIAAVLEGFDFLGLERDEGYADIARARIGWWELHGHDALRIVAEQEAAEAEREAVRESGQMELL